MAVWQSVKKLFSVQDSIPLKTRQDWRDAEYRWSLLGREGLHALGSFLATNAQLAFYPDGWISRVAAVAVVLAVLGVKEFAETYRGQQPWKGLVDYLVWAAASVAAAVTF